MAAATRKGNSILFTAVTDTYAAQVVCPNGITFRGTGLTAAQQVLLTDDDGDIVADFVISAATQYADLWNGRAPDQFYRGLKMSGTVGGTWTLTVYTD